MVQGRSRGELRVMAWAERVRVRRPFRAWWVAVLLALAIARPSAAQRTTAAPAYEEGAFELVVAGLPAAPLQVLVSPRGAYLLPVLATLERLGIPHEVVQDSALVRFTRPGGASRGMLRWSLGAPNLALDAAVPLDSTDVVVRQGVVYLAAPRMAQLVEGIIDVELASLTVRAQRSTEFPAQILAGVHQRRGEQLRRVVRDTPTVRPAIPFHPTTGFGVVEWAVGGPLAPLGSPTSVEARMGMGLYGGLLKTGGVVSLPGRQTSPGLGDSELSYHRAFPDGTLLRQVQLGDIISNGALARPIRGFSLTNAPFLRSQRFGELPFFQPLPPGWEYEVYQGDRLIGFADATTHSALNIPLQYGTTPLRVRLYGPAGETVESSVSYVIPVDQLPAGEWQYAVGGGRCAAQQCAETGYADVKRGFTRYLTVQAGADETRDSTTRIFRPYGAVSVIPAPGWTAQLQARHSAFLRGSVQRFGEGRVTGSATLGMNAAGEGGIAVARANDGAIFAQASLQLLHVVPLMGERGLNVSTRVERPQHGGDGRWDFSTFVPVERGMVEVGVQSDPLMGVVPEATGAPLFRVAPTLTLSRGQLRRLGSPIIRVEAGVQRGALAQWDVGLSLQPGRGSANLSIRHLVGGAGTQLNVGGSVALGVARVLARVTSRAGVVEGAYSANGAVAFGSVRHATALDYGGLGLSGIEGRVFRDRDGDGRFGQGDEPAAEVIVEVGGLRTRSDSSGRYSLWNTLPYEPVDVRIDSLSIEEPSWVPAVSLHALRPSPQQYSRVDFPLVHMREVIGRIAGRAGDAMGGVGLELRSEETGVLYETRTFSDGGFYLGRVRAGRYVLTLTPSSQRALGAAPASRVVVVVPPAGDEVVEVPVVTLVPLAQVPGTAR